MIARHKSGCPTSRRDVGLKRHQCAGALSVRVPCGRVGWTMLAFVFFLISCRTPPPPTGTVVLILESSPNNLDLRQGTDVQSERVGSLIFDPLVKKDAHF